MIYQRTATVAPEKTVSPSVLPVRFFSTTGGKRAAMKMHEIEVSTGQGVIEIFQAGSNGEQVAIIISPDQADLVCKWIMVAAAELSSAEER